MIQMRAFVLPFLMVGLLALPASAADNPLQASARWDDMKRDVVGEAEVLDGSDLLALEAPYRAHDAALVPVTITELAGSDEDFVRLILVIDENPAPVAAEFEVGPAMGEIALETRVRVNAYSNVRVLAETADGELYMVGRFVKASGGCSAPALKDPDAALAGLGKMKMRLFEAAAGAEERLAEGRPEAQVMVRHPNYSGLQMDQVTQLYIPAHFVDDLTVKLGDELVFRMSGGISISEDPNVRFAFRDNGAEHFAVEAHDTDGAAFGQSFPVEALRPKS